MINQCIAQAIQARRDALRLSMRAAAAAGGISPTAWSDLEAGKHPPTPATQRKIATALQWPIDWLDVVAAGGEPIKQPDAPSATLEQRVTAVEGQLRELLTLVQVKALAAEGVELAAVESSRPKRRARRA